MKPSFQPTDVAGALAVAGLGVASALGFAGSLDWTLDLLSHFRAQYAAAALALAGLSLWSSRGRLAGTALAVAFLNAACLAPAWVRIHPRPPAAGPLATLSVVLSNVSLESRNAGLGAALAARHDPDLFGFVEVDERWVAELDAALAAWPHRRRLPRDNHYGIALYSRLPLDAVEVLPVNDARYPALLARLRVGGRPVRVLVAHAHPPFQARVARMRDRQLERLAEIRRAEPGPFVLLGDLNATPWSHGFRALVRDGDLRDTREGFGLQASWPARLPGLRIPLDHCLVSPEWVVLDRQVGPDVGSDHLPVAVRLGLATAPPDA